MRRGRPEVEIPKLARQAHASAVHFSADVSGFAQSRDRRVAEALAVPVQEHPGLCVIDELDAIRTTAGLPYTVFTPCHRTWARVPRRRRQGAPRALPPLPPALDRGALPTLKHLGLCREVDDPMPGSEHKARERLKRFLARGAADYADTRNLVAEPGTSRLSPYLHFGCLSPVELEERVRESEFRRQLGWRDFFAHVLLHFPANAHREHQARYRGTVRWSHAR